MSFANSNRKKMKELLLSLTIILYLALPSVVQAQQNIDSITAATGTVVLNPGDTATTIFIGSTGTWVGTHVLEFLPINSTTWASLTTCLDLSSLTAITSFTTNKNIVCSNNNFQSVRVRASAFASGTSVIAMRASTNNGTAGLPFGGTLTSDSDDGSIASGQTGILATLGLGQYFNGTVWKRDVGCDSQIIYDASTNGNTQLVGISGTTTIYVCDYTIFSAGTANVSLVAGTGSACASAASGTPSTGTSGASAGLTPAFQFTAQTGIVKNSPAHGYTFNTGSANALCIKTSAGVAVQALVSYAQY